MIYPFRKTVYNCRQATLLSIKKEEGKISLLERAKLSYHLLYCGPCQRFIKQWRQLNDKVRREIEVPPAFTLSEDSFRRIQRLIDDLGPK